MGPEAGSRKHLSVTDPGLSGVDEMSNIRHFAETIEAVALIVVQQRFGVKYDITSY